MIGFLDTPWFFLVESVLRDQLLVEGFPALLRDLVWDLDYRVGRYVRPWVRDVGRWKGFRGEVALDRGLAEGAGCFAVPACAWSC